MLVELGRVEIPGYADALRRERELRMAAFVDVPGGIVRIGGVPVRILTLRLLHHLRAGGNGFVTPFRFDEAWEVYSHALDFAWKLSPLYRVPRADVALDLGYHARRLWWLLSLRLRRVDPDRLVSDLYGYLSDVFADSPFTGGNDTAADNGKPTTAQSRATQFTPPTACEAASLIDQFAEAGYPWSADEILDCPLPRLWQHIRLIQRRVYGVRPVSRAQQLATEYMATRRN